MRTIGLKFTVLSIFFFMSLNMVAQQECIVVMNEDYSYEDPREGFLQTLEKGSAHHVYKCESGYEYYGSYTAASVILPFEACHIPGSVKGEKCIVINGTNLRLRQGPSTSSGIYCYDSGYGGSIAQEKFIIHPEKELGVYGTSYSWKPFYLPKGTRLPFLGKEKGFYKTAFRGETFYVSTKYCYVK